ncbi:hypothetical protein HNR19_001143 [Nocardioides thalensis]|uniref:Uncharacterized protein n=1 Tax=Nocardioides thalensis TaxID=1914755 RepID=A0A853BYZ6_9ACTN|nr:hypothetical protein [Nocardioides thalensis]NYJ00445.1 hypothetical protein [Nocardioides thalensis]
MNTQLDDGADVRATLHRALHDTTAPDVTSTAMAAGRRIRNRRRGAVAAGGISAIAAVGALTFPALGGGGSTAPDPVPLGGSPSQSPSHPFPPVDEGWWSMPAPRMLAELEARLPSGVTNADPGTDAEERRGQPGNLWLHLDAPTGTGAFNLLLQPPIAELPTGTRTWTDENGEEHTSVAADPVPYERRIGCKPEYLRCELIRDEDGTVIGDVSTEVDEGTTYHNADLVLPDGGAINVYVADSTGDKPGYAPPTADAPPLTFEQVLELVQDPVWVSYQP